MYIVRDMFSGILLVYRACLIYTYTAAGAGTQGQLGEKAAEFKKIFRDEVGSC